MTTLSDPGAGDADRPAAAADTAGGGPTSWYPWYVLGVLTVANFFNNLDRYYFSVALEAIKKDIGASDTQMSLLAGFAFASVYGIACIPIAIWSDRGVRKRILALALAFWSAATFACGGAGSFLSMAVARASVGVGEAGGVPTSNSILSDYFSRHRRPLAFSIFYASNSLSLCVGLPLVGMVVAMWGWRAAFFVLGLAGLAFAPVVLFGIKEPQRGALDEAAERSLESASFADCLRRMLASRPFMILLLSQLIAYCGIAANSAWTAAFFLRVYHLTYPEVTALNGIPFGLAGLFGGGVGGALIGFLVRRTGKDHWMATVPALAAIFSAPALVVAYGGGPLWVSATFAILGFFFIMVRMGSSVALSMDYMPPAYRAQTAAVLVIIQSVIAGAIGPLLVGLISDHLAPTVGAESGLRIAMQVVIPVLLAVGGCFGFQPVRKHSEAP